MLGSHSSLFTQQQNPLGLWETTVCLNLGLELVLAAAASIRLGLPLKEISGGAAGKEHCLFGVSK